MSTADFSATTQGITVDVVAGTATGPDIGTVPLNGATDVVGGSGADTITGDANANTLQGGLGNDVLRGAGGADILEGGADGDYLSDEDSGDDHLIGGTGDDYLYVSHNDGVSSVTLEGNEDNDYLHLEGMFVSIALSGGSGDDHLSAHNWDWSSSNDIQSGTLDGGEDNDYLDVQGPGVRNVMVLGGAGADTLHAYHVGAGVTLDGGEDNDTIVVDYIAPASDLVVKGGTGADTVRINQDSQGLSVDFGADADRDTLEINRSIYNLGSEVLVQNFTAGAGGDILELSSLLNQFVPHWDGDANPWGTAGFLKLVQEGADTLIQVDPNGGGDAWQTLVRLDGVTAEDLVLDNINVGSNFPLDGTVAEGETFVGTEGDDSHTGTAGGDLLQGNDANDTLQGGPGSDTIEGGDNDDQLYGDVGADTLRGDGGNDLLNGGLGTDRLEGGADNDQLQDFDSGDDVLIGGTGDDSLYVNRNNRNQGGSSVTLEGNEDNDYLHVNGSFASVSLSGGSGDDHLSAHNWDWSSSNDIQSGTLDGGEDNDYLDVQGPGVRNVMVLGGAGADTLHAYHVGAGVTLDGGEDNDTIVVDYIAPASDLVVKGGTGADTVRINQDSQGLSVDFGADADRDTLEINRSIYNLGSEVLVQNFTAGAGGDILELSSLLNQFVPHWDGDANPWGTAGFLKLVQEGADTLIQVDRDGGGDAFQTLVRLEGVTLADLTNANVNAGGYPFEISEQVLITSTAGVKGTNSLEITGTAKPGSMVDLYEGDTLLGQTVVEEDGTWRIPVDGLSDGPHTFVAKALNENGTPTGTSPALDLVVDTVPPDAPIIEVQDGLTNNAMPTLVGLGEAGATIKIFLDDNPVAIGETIVGSDNTWTLPLQVALPEGEHVLKAVAVDEAGHESLVTDLSLIVDTLPPGMLAFDIEPGSLLTSNALTLSGRGGEPGATVEISDGGVILGTTTVSEDGSWSLDVADLAEGEHTFTAVAVDEAGNPSESALLPIAIDTVAPEQPVVLSQEGFTTDNTPFIHGLGEVGTTITVQDGLDVLGTTTVLDDGTWSFDFSTTFADRAYNFTLKATDAAGHVSDETAYQFTVDTLAPNAPAVVTPGQNGVVLPGALTLTGEAEPGSTVRVYEGGVVIGETFAEADGTWSLLTEPLSEGVHALSVKSQDEAGNISPAKDLSVFARTGPLVTLTSAALTSDAGASSTDNISNQGGMTLTGTADPGATITLYGGVDGTTKLSGSTIVGASGTWSLTTTLPEGTHHLSVQATYKSGFVGKTEPTADTFVIDKTPPTTLATPTLTTDTPMVSGQTTDTTPTVKGTGAEANTKVLVYDNGALLGTTTSDATGAWSLTPTSGLTDGRHSFRAKQEDLAGNLSAFSAASNVTIDTTPPPVPSVTRISDDLGASGSDGITSDNSLWVYGTAEASSTVKVYNGTTLIGTVKAGSTGAWSLDYTKTLLKDGSYDLTAVASDALGNTSAASSVFKVTVDRTAPTATITSALTDSGATASVSNGGATKDASLTLVGKAEAGAAVEVKLGSLVVGTTTANASGDWSLDYTAASDGKLTFTATTKDLAGNTSTAASFAVTVDTKAPTSEVTAAVTSKSTLISGTADAGSAVQILENGSVIGTTTAGNNGTWKVTLSPALSDTVHTLTSRATDQVGNVGQQAGVTLVGSSLGDTLTGNATNDVLLGYGGADKLNGGAGNDRYTGGTGADTFMFLGQFGTDTVTDYVDNSDKLDLDAGLSFANLTFTTVDADGDKMADDVLIKTSTGQSINVLNMAAASLTASDFQF